jgi:hypothetical protein
VSTWPARLATDLLDAAEACYAGPRTPPCPPDRYLTFGLLPALNCDALLVTFTGVEPRAAFTGGAVGNRCTAIPRARLAVWIVRCFPTITEDGDAPPPNDVQAATALLDWDLGCLWDGLIGRWSDKALFPNFPGLDCEAVSFGVAQPYGPQGGVAGWQLPVLVDLVGVRSDP